VLTTPLPNNENDYKTRFFMLETAPPELQYKIARAKSAYEAYQFIKSKYMGGGDASYVRELEDKLSKLKMMPHESLDLYVHRADELRERLTDNLRTPLPDVVMDKVIDGLPSVFDESKSSLRVNGRGKDLEETRKILAKTAINVGWEPTKPGQKKEEKQPYALNVGKQGHGGGKGNQKKGNHGNQGQGKNRYEGYVLQKMWEVGHIAKDCLAPAPKAFRAPNPTPQRPLPRAEEAGPSGHYIWVPNQQQAQPQPPLPHPPMAAVTTRVKLPQVQLAG